MAASDYHGFRWTEATCGRHFKMLPREIVAKEGPNGLEPSIWSTLGRSAQALLPVLLRHADPKGMAYPGEGRIAAMAGITRKTARQAATELEERGLIEIRSTTSRQGRLSKAYRLASSCEGVAMPSIFVDGGLWAELRPAAKALAVAFRLFARARPDLDPDFDESEYNYGAFLSADTWDGDGIAGEDWQEYLNTRTVDFCNAEPSVLRDFAGIGPRIDNDACASLIKRNFIIPDRDRPDYWQVVVWPSNVMKVSYLNSKLDGEGW
jgi:hypothetical protein